MDSDLILWDVEREHLKEAEFLFDLRQARLCSPHYTVSELGARLERRLEAHIDGLHITDAPQDAKSTGWGGSWRSRGCSSPGSVFPVSCRYWRARSVYWRPNFCARSARTAARSNAARLCSFAWSAPLSTCAQR